MIRLIRTALRVLLVLLAGALVLASMALIALRIGVATWAVNIVLAEINPFPGTELTTDKAVGNGFSWLELKGIRLTRTGGEVPLSAAKARIRYDGGSLLTRRIVFHELRLAGTHLVVQRRSDSSWDLPKLRRKQPESRGTAGTRVSIQRISLTDGSILVWPGATQRDSLTASVAGEGSLGPRGLEFSRLAGRSHLAYRDLRFLGSRFDRGGELDLTAEARGTTRRLEFQLNATLTDGGTAQARGVLPLRKNVPLEYRLRAGFRAVDPALFVSGRALPQHVDGTVVLDLTGDHRDRLDGRTDLKVHSSASRDRRQVVVGAVFGKGRAQIDAASHLGFASVRLRGWARPFDSVPSYDLTALAEQLQPTSSPTWKGLLGNETRSLRLRLEGSGFQWRKADLRASASVGSGGRSGMLDSSSAEVHLVDGKARFKAHAGVNGGSLGATGTARLSPRIQLRSVLRADISYASHTLTDGRFDLNLDSGTVHLAGGGQFDGGSVDAVAIGHPFQSIPIVTLRRLGFRQLDLERLAPGRGISGNISGSVTGKSEGRRLGQLKLSSVIRLESSQIGKQAVTSATILTELVRGRVDFKVHAHAPDGQIALTGFALPFDSVPRIGLREAEFRQLDVGRLLSQEKLHSRLTGSLRAETSGLQPRIASATGVLTLRNSALNDIVISSGRVEASLVRGALDISGKLLAHDDSVTVVATVFPFESRPRLRLRSDVTIGTLARLFGDKVPDAGGTGGIRLLGEWGTPATMSLKGELVGRGYLTDVKLDSLRTRFGMKGGVLTIDTLALRSSVGTAAGSGTVAWFGSAAGISDLSLVGRLGNIAPLAALLGLPQLRLDSGGFTASVHGPQDSLRLSLVAQGGNIQIGSRRIGALQASFSGDLAADHSLSSGTADVYLERLLTGRARIRDIRLQGTKDGSNILVRAATAIDRDRSIRLLTHLDLAGSRIQLDSLDILEPRGRWALAHSVSVTYGDRLQVDDFRLASGRRRIALDGVVDRRGEQRLSGNVDSLGLGRLADLLGAPDLDGQVNGSFTLSGPAAAPHAQGELEVAIRSRDKEVGTGRGRLDWTTAGLVLGADIRQKEGDSLKLSGRIPVAFSLEAGDSAGIIRRIPGGVLALTAATDRFRLDGLEPLFNAETLQKLRGDLRVNAHAAGTIEAPELSGDVTLADGRIRIPRLGATYDHAQLDFRLQGRELRLTQAHLESGGGRADANGTIQLRAFPAVAFDLETTLSNFRIAASEDFRSSLSGRLKLGGTAAAPVLTGSLDVRKTDVYLQAKNLQQSAEAVELSPEDLRTLERRFGYSESRSGAARKPLARWDIGLKLQLSENNWLRRRSDPVMAVELGGNLKVRKPPRGDINVVGEIKPLPGRSFVQVMGRRFDLREGAVTLNGPLTQTAVALKAEYRAASPSGTQPVVITTAVRSDTGKLTVTLSSIPVMRAEDIMSYLTTGRPATTDPTLESDEKNALNTSASLAVGAALGTVAGSAGQKLGLDVVQVLQDREGGQTLVAGKYVSPPLYLGFRQPIVPPTNTGSSETQRDVVEFEVEYATVRQLLLNLQGGGSEVRVFLRLRR